MRFICFSTMTMILGIISMMFCFIIGVKYWNAPNVALPASAVLKEATRGTQGHEKGGGRMIHLCSMAQLTSGRWVNNTYERPLYIPMRGEVQQKICQGIDRNGPWHTWDWHPSSDCSFSRFNQDMFCRLAFNKTIAIIGDSISFDHFLSLTHLLGIPQALPRVMKKFANLKSQVCNGTSMLVGQRDFFLQNSIADIVNTTFPDIMVLNRGAHYTPDTVLTDAFHQTIFPQLRDWQSRCQQLNRQCLLIWRTTVPGHPNCSQYTQPAVSLQEMEALVASQAAVTNYKWDQFSSQNKLVLDLFQNASLDYRVMDAYPINILRPDAHKHGNKNDCLHTVRGFWFKLYSWFLSTEQLLTYLCVCAQCLPGDDVYSELLLHMMRLKNDSLSM